jgi:hypothetical protein
MAIMDPNTRENVEAVLLGAARAYGIKVGRDEVQHVLDDPAHGVPFAEWANMHLGAGNLLTADEMAL